MIDTPGKDGVALLLGLLAANGLFRSITMSSWNSWIRDLVPQKVLGRFFSRRMALAALVGAVFSLGAAFFVDYWPGATGVDNKFLPYTIVLLFGILCLGMLSPVFMSLMPEPMMQPPEKEGVSLRERLMLPLRDKNFRKLVIFLLLWCFALNLATPFFTVYMLTRLELPLSWTIGLSIVSQVFNIVFLRVWGKVTDRFGNKVVLSMCSSLYLLVIFGWLFTSMPDRYLLTIPLLILLHVFAGIAMAGVNLSVGTIGLKLAPSGNSVPYLASASMATNIGTGIGPLLGGLIAAFFNTRSIYITFTWIDTTGSTGFPVLVLNGIDFLYVVAFALGVVTLGLLTTFREEGEVNSDVVLSALINPSHEMAQSMTSVPEMSFFSDFPFSYLKRIRIPGLDVALGVTVYQIAELSRLAAVAALRGRKLTRRLGYSLMRDIAGLTDSKVDMKKYGVEISRQAARGAMHVIEDQSVDIEQVESEIVSSVIRAVTGAGVDLEDAFLGVSQGIIEGASETRSDVGSAARKVIEAAAKVSKQVNISEESAVAKIIEGTLQASGNLDSKTFDKVKQSLPVKEEPTVVNKG